MVTANQRTSGVFQLLQLLLFAYLLAGTSAHAEGLFDRKASRPPNILLIITDDQRWDQLGVVQRELGDRARFPFLDTSRLDRLAAEGVRFRNAFVTTSLCSPSRSAILTGQYNHTNGIIDNDTPFSPRPTWATALADAGYITGYFGKWHHGMQRERPGFHRVASYPGHGQYFDTTFYLNNSIIGTRTKGYIDDHTVDFAIDFISQLRNRPFALVVGLKAVHQPFEPMPAHAENYAGERIRPATNWDYPPPWSNLRKPSYTRRQPNARFWHRIIQTVDGIDYNVGRLVDALEEYGLASNTLVIFTSDNGYYLGEHRLGDKRSAYEESMRVPMILRMPGTVPAGEVFDNMVLNIDLAPTLMEFAGVEVSSEVQGESIKPLLSGEGQNWRGDFLYEHWLQPVQRDHGLKQRQTRDILGTPTILAVRTPTHKLITYPGNDGWIELFDLVEDPGETHNLAGYRSHLAVRNDLCDRLERLLLETDYQPGLPLDSWHARALDTHRHGEGRVASGGRWSRVPLLQPDC